MKIKLASICGRPRSETILATLWIERNSCLMQITLFRAAFAFPALVGAANAAQGQTIVLNFDSLPAMTFLSGSPIPVSARLSDRYLRTYGVRFNSGAGYAAVINLGTGHATSGVNGIGGSTPTGNLTYNAANPITMTFFDPVHPSVAAVTDFVSVRADLIGDSGESPTLFAYDINEALIGSNSEPDTGGQTMKLSIPGIHSVRFSGVVAPDGGPGGAALDDFTFHTVTAAVPEPGTVAFVASASLLTVLLLSKRRRK